MRYWDVSEDAVEKEAIDLATRLHLIGGYTDGTFRANYPVSIAQMCKVFSLIANNMEDPSYSIEIDSNIRHWARYYYYFCQNIGIADGISPDDLDNGATFLDLSRMISQYRIIKENFWYAFPIGKDMKIHITRADLCIALVGALRNYVEPYIVDANKSLSEKNFIALLGNIKHLRNYECLAPSRLHPYLKMASYRNKYSESIMAKLFEYVCDMNAIFSEHFGLDEDTTIVYHYTNLKTLECLTAGSKLRLSNTITLNDPMEGRGFQKILREKPWEEETFIKGLGEPLEKLNYYIVSFTNEESDTIPMWYQYSKEGTGCRIAYHVSDDLRNKLFRVTYDQKRISDFISAAAARCTRECYVRCNIDGMKDILEDYCKDVLTRASFLYKDKSYEHEKEIRIVERVDPSDALEEDRKEIKNGEIFPRVYTEVAERMNMVGVLLGPKVSERTQDQVTLSLRHRGYGCEIRKSGLNFR